MSATVKQEARAAIDRLPDDADWDQVLDAIEVERKIDRGLADIAAGRVVSHEEVRRRIQRYR